MKKRRYLKALICFLFVAGASLLITPEAESVPAFARQTGMSCNTCHYQHYPSLNSVGRAFKSSGFTMVGGQSMIEGELLSIPASLNASVVLKVRGKKTNGNDDTSGKNKGIIEFPDEGVLLFGGKVGERIGFLLEAQLKAPEDSAWASFKMPITVAEVKGTNLSLIPFTTDGPGPAYGFELLNTGAMRIQRVLEDRKAISAQQYIGTGDRAATGISFVAANPKYFANYTLWAPEHGTTDAGPYLHYLRAAVTPNFKGWDLGAGFQVWAGNTNFSDPAVSTWVPTTPGCITGCTMKLTTTETIMRKKASAWALDAQAQGSVGKYPLGLYVTYANAESSDAQRANFFNSSTNDDKTAFSVLAELGVIPGRLTLAAGYLAGDRGTVANSEQNSTSLAAIYMIKQNISLQINHTAMSGDYYDLPANNENKDGDRQTIVMISAGF